MTDGPYVEASEITVSFGVIQTDDYESALAIAGTCPGDLAIEIRELVGYARYARADRALVESRSDLQRRPGKSCCF